MIQSGSNLKVTDNSGILLTKCIKIIGNNKSKKAKIGNLIVVSVKKFKNNYNLNNFINLKKKRVILGLILTTKTPLNQKNGFFIKFEKNSIICMDNQNNFIGNRIFGFVPRKLKKKFSKLIGLSSNFV